MSRPSKPPCESSLIYCSTVQSMLHCSLLPLVACVGSRSTQHALQIHLSSGVCSWPIQAYRDVYNLYGLKTFRTPSLHSLAGIPRRNSTARQWCSVIFTHNRELLGALWNFPGYLTTEVLLILIYRWLNQPIWKSGTCWQSRQTYEQTHIQTHTEPSHVSGVGQVHAREPGPGFKHAVGGGAAQCTQQVTTSAG